MKYSIKLFVTVVSALISLSSQASPSEFAAKLSEAAIDRTSHSVTYDGRYVSIAYPGGDVPSDTGVCTDVVIRSYRTLGIDLQQLVHEDITANFEQYPSKRIWGLTRPDTNIDHRRVPNLRTFFSRHGESLPVTQRPQDYLPGDIVSWRLPNNLPHIGVVVDVRSTDRIRPWVVHNIGLGPQMEDMLFSFEITGHYRYHH